jgi:CDGSH-type Zn-finger protein
MSSEPVVAQKGPFAVDLEAGKTYYWCRCGRSQKQPFCDGSHRGTELEPVAVTTERSETMYLCGCKHSHEAPFCDGTHKDL